MIVYVFRFADRATATAALPALWTPPAEDMPGRWDESRVLETAWIVTEAERDEEGNITAPAIAAPGFFLAVACGAIDEDLWAVPECISEVDVAAARETRTRLPVADRTPGRFDPIWAGFPASIAPPSAV